MTLCFLFTGESHGKQRNNWLLLVQGRTFGLEWITQQIPIEVVESLSYPRRRNVRTENNELWGVNLRAKPSLKTEEIPVNQDDAKSAHVRGECLRIIPSKYRWKSILLIPVKKMSRCKIRYNTHYTITVHQRGFAQC